MKVTESRKSAMRVLLNANKRTVGPKCINMRYFIDVSAHRPRYATICINNGSKQEVKPQMDTLQSKNCVAICSRFSMKK